MVIPLEKLTRKGEPYKRRSETEQVLNELDQLTPDQKVKRLTSTQQAVPMEVLIYYIRHVNLALEAKELEPIFMAFYRRLEMALRRAVTDAQYDSAHAIREEILERVVEMLANDRNTQNDKMYYWEVNFNHALSNLRTDTLRGVGPARESDPLVNSGPITHEGEDGYEISPEVDSAASECINPNPSKLDDPAFRLRLYDAISDLPDEERRSIGLLLKGMPIDSKDPNVMTIADAMDCTEKTVRNRLKRAHEKLRQVLLEEVIL